VMASGRHSVVRSALVAAAALASACASDDQRAAPPEDFDDLTLEPADDENPAPDVLEVRLRAAESEFRYPGSRSARVWAYDGRVPGPLLDAKLGDELVVHFENALAEPTTIHWHGVRVPAAMDGSLAMQSPIAPGGSFEYRFRFKDPGLFWYHPHVRSDVQVHKGLYGVIRVRGPDEPEADHESILVLDDIEILPDGTISDYLDDESKMLGRQGSTLLVSGRANPRLGWRSGSLQRLRIVNVANGRFFNLSLPGYTFRVIGSDGGLIPEPYDAERVLVAPGERYDVLVLVTGAPGTETTLINEPYERGHETGKASPMPIARVRISDEPALEGRTLPVAFEPIERLLDGPSLASIVLDEGLRGPDLVFTINGQTYPDVPVIPVDPGAIARLDIENASEMDHPFHLHGFFFQLLGTGGLSPADAFGNKDTIIVPKESKLRLVARFDEPGAWMYHCHILEHAEGGMMGEIHVRE
jgi:FtsP/CotA-like multicopper oxidase with cupredoxin domain